MEHKLASKKKKDWKRICGTMVPASHFSLVQERKLYTKLEAFHFGIRSFSLSFWTIICRKNIVFFCINTLGSQNHIQLQRRSLWHLVASPILHGFAFSQVLIFGVSKIWQLSVDGICSSALETFLSSWITPTCTVFQLHRDEFSL